MVAVLMTDLVGSTAIADRVGPAVAEELRTEHLGLLRGAFEHTAGRDVKNLDDGLMVVFLSASESLACAVELIFDGVPTIGTTSVLAPSFWMYGPQTRGFWLDLEKFVPAIERSVRGLPYAARYSVQTSDRPGRRGACHGPS
jgi:hypothetical protein